MWLSAGRLSRSTISWVYSDVCPTTLTRGTAIVTHIEDLLSARGAWSVHPAFSLPLQPLGRGRMSAFEDQSDMPGFDWEVGHCPYHSNVHHSGYRACRTPAARDSILYSVHWPDQHGL